MRAPWLEPGPGSPENIATASALLSGPSPERMPQSLQLGLRVTTCRCLGPDSQGDERAIASPIFARVGAADDGLPIDARERPKHALIGRKRDMRRAFNANPDRAPHHILAQVHEAQITLLPEHRRAVCQEEGRPASCRVPSGLCVSSVLTSCAPILMTSCPTCGRIDGLPTNTLPATLVL